ncbi:tetratricopeptide repeat protein [Candidatus Saccharibacteria bacterium]|nr:tetratricopeptide repeat protein [Candidatus Saccharibacteria bacterium]MCL1963058.1 tetratricopeptide repeat protein [Candidatus Saccharibacteria bacterium]
MFGILAIILLGALVVFWRPRSDEPRKPAKLAEQLDKLWDISQKSIREKKYLRAEKALLTLLRVDERNARAYSRLGILYAKQQQYDDAIECFEIAQSLQPSASSLHNVGLIYYETGKLEKAAQAFEQALLMEEDVASRHIAYAKVLEAEDRTPLVIQHLERAVELEPNPQSVGLLADALERDGQTERADKLHLIAIKMVEKGNRSRVKQPAKVQI